MAHIGKELRLVLAGLRKLAALVLDFVEQPHVLDRDHRLVGKGGDQLDLLVGEWPTSLRVNMMTPIGHPSRRSGTPSTVRYPPTPVCSRNLYPGRPARQPRAQFRRRARRARAPIRPGHDRMLSHVWSYSREYPKLATNGSIPLGRWTAALSASQSAQPTPRAYRAQPAGRRSSG